MQKYKVRKAIRHGGKVVLPDTEIELDENDPVVGFMSGRLYIELIEEPEEKPEPKKKTVKKKKTEEGA